MLGMSKALNMILFWQRGGPSKSGHVSFLSASSLNPERLFSPIYHGTTVDVCLHMNVEWSACWTNTISIAIVTACKYIGIESRGYSEALGFCVRNRTPKIVTSNNIDPNRWFRFPCEFSGVKANFPHQFLPHLHSTTGLAKFVYPIGGGTGKELD